MMIKNITFALIFISLLSCGGKPATRNADKSVANIEEKKEMAFSFTSPKMGANVKSGETVEVAYKLKSKELESVADTAVLYVNGKEVSRFVGEKTSFKMNENRVGSVRLKLVLLQNGVEKANTQMSINHLPAAPKKYSYKVVKTYPHNENSFTQGLFFDDGFLYEGTGRNGESALMKNELATGKTLKSANLDSKYFGEGVAEVGNKIYQITWQSKTAFVYDKETFNKLSTFTYTTEGWGLTTENNLLVMSDGSHIIKFVEPSNFNEIRRIEVFNDKGKVENINELEYIDGLIWANVWTKDIIVMIDPESGAVVGEVNLAGIYPARNEEYCLNGIAYDAKGKRIFVTGKCWNKLFEISVN